MNRLARSAGLVTAAILVIGVAPVAGAAASPSVASGPVTPQHDVTCTIVMTQPYAITSTAVAIESTTYCNGSPDIAYTTLQLQIKAPGETTYKNFGDPVTSTSTVTTLPQIDTAGMRAGCHYYRGRVVREGFHGNWATTTKYSTWSYLCR